MTTRKRSTSPPPTVPSSPRTKTLTANPPPAGAPTSRPKGLVAVEYQSMWLPTRRFVGEGLFDRSLGDDDEAGVVGLEEIVGSFGVIGPPRPGSSRRRSCRRGARAAIGRARSVGRRGR